jgi:hypothetical protein
MHTPQYAAYQWQERAKTEGGRDGRVTYSINNVTPLLHLALTTWLSLVPQMVMRESPYLSDRVPVYPDDQGFTRKIPWDMKSKFMPNGVLAACGAHKITAIQERAILRFFLPELAYEFADGWIQVGRNKVHDILVEPTL